MSRKLQLVGFVIAVVVVGWVIGWFNVPGDWYAGLAKPWFNPPNWIFGPVWTLLYIAIGIAGWRVWTKTADKGLQTLWAIQMALNFAWSPAFFGLQNTSLALLVIGLLLVTIIAFTMRAFSLERISAMLFVPYIAWVTFATLLNTAIWWLN